MNIKSPCIQVCFINPDNGLCLGCNRSLHEIEHWLKYDDVKRDEIMKILPLRENIYSQ